MGWLNKFWGEEKPKEEVELKPQDVTISPTSIVKALRAAHRLSRLYKLGEYHPGCQEERAVYRATLAGLGYKAPKTLNDTLALIKQLEEI